MAPRRVVPSIALDCILRTGGACYGQPERQVNRGKEFDPHQNSRPCCEAVPATDRTKAAILSRQAGGYTAMQ